MFSSHLDAKSGFKSQSSSRFSTQRLCEMHRRKGQKRQVQIKHYCSNSTEVLHFSSSPPLSFSSLSWRRPVGNTAYCCLLDGQLVQNDPFPHHPDLNATKTCAHTHTQSPPTKQIHKCQMKTSPPSPALVLYCFKMFFTASK